MKPYLTRAAIAGLALAGMAGAAQAQDCPIKLGAVLPVSGPMGQVGERIADTGQFAVDLFNEAGGVKSVLWNCSAVSCEALEVVLARAPNTETLTILGSTLDTAHVVGTHWLPPPRLDTWTETVSPPVPGARTTCRIE